MSSKQIKEITQNIPNDELNAAYDALMNSNLNKTSDYEEISMEELNEYIEGLECQAEDLRKQLAKANERVKELENSFKQSIPIVDTLYALARNQLWIAYVWNDHNFPLNPEKYAKEAAESMGITNVDDANKLVEAFKQLRKEQE